MQNRRGAQVIVIHPGSRFLRIGKASDVNPLTVPNVIARRCKPPVPTPTRVEGVSRPRKERREAHSSELQRNDDEYGVTVTSDDPVCMYVLTFFAIDERVSVRCQNRCNHSLTARSDAILQTSCNR